MNEVTIEQLDWQKVHDLIPAIIQDADTLQVLMLGYMDKAALKTTQDSNAVTFYSRSKQRLWTKGETSGNTLTLVDIMADCDNDTLLLLVNPKGPCCHRQTTSCFTDKTAPGIGFIAHLKRIIEQRSQQNSTSSYTAELMAAGTKRIAQKVGEEGVEVALAATAGDKNETIAEIADLLYHTLVLMTACKVDLSDIVEELMSRHSSG